MNAKLQPVKACMMLCLLLSFLSISCSEDMILERNSTSRSENAVLKEENLVKFAIILSKAVHQRMDLRDFLKEEALKQFDRNYDVLYYLVKDEVIGDESFRDILISYSSTQELESIERSIPLLNIYLSKIEFFDVLPENLDTNDADVPVIVSKSSENVLFYNGNEELTFDKGEVPDFHVFVVNENTRVTLPENSHMLRGRKGLNFRSPIYDGINPNSVGQVETAIGIENVDFKSLEAFKHFYKDDESINRKGFQRDYIYYGITPEKRQGSLNLGVTEYIQFLEIDPVVYYDISNQRNAEIYNGDPFVNNTVAVRKSRKGFSEAELVNKMWSKGAYNFRFEVFTTEGSPLIVYAPLRPEEIWDFNIDHTYRNSTWLRKGKHTYKIDPSKFTSKKVFLPHPVTIGKWDIRNESIIRYIKVYEEDQGLEVLEKDVNEMFFVHKSNFIGSSKISLGLKNEVNEEVGVFGVVNSPMTKSKFIEHQIYRSSESDYLGHVKMSFYDPVIDAVDVSNNSVDVFTYNTGVVKIGILVE
ncbi:hypothetical protein MM239_06945 [Belliella sp. DSM 111904]|uniref:Major fimbrial subunit protein N-terminal domain-containing protein n=1 Tax=Belliella filtrata TaxID=2923435 RepID=A0ABS9UY99_9BACT|nr:hypothetical protein [Belliella filtrata]MCH7409124.1 hypothetical protein [Belliella filtrata]